MSVAYSLTSKYKGLVPQSGVTQREFNKIVARAAIEMGKYWHEKYLPLHFTNKALNRYSAAYKQRSPGYNRQKRRRKGHQRPNVYSGESKRRALRTEDVRATSTRNRTRSRVYLHSPALNLKNPNSDIDMQVEMRYINKSEAGTLARVLGDSIDQELQRLPQEVTFKHKG